MTNEKTTCGNALSYRADGGPAVPFRLRRHGRISQPGRFGNSGGIEHADTDTYTNADTDANIHTGTDANIHTGTDAHTHADAHTHTYTNADTNTHADAGADADTYTHTVIQPRRAAGRGCRLRLLRN